MSRNRAHNPYHLPFPAAEILATRLNKAMPNWHTHLPGAKMLKRDHSHVRIPDGDTFGAAYTHLIDVRDPLTCEGLRRLVVLKWPGCRVQVNDAGTDMCYVKVWSTQSKRYVYDGDEDRLAVAYIKAIEAGDACHTAVLRRHAA